MKLSAITSMKIPSKAFLTTTLALLLGTAGSAYAAPTGGTLGPSTGIPQTQFFPTETFCPDRLTAESNWLKNAPNGYTRSLGVVMVSNDTENPNVSSMKMPEVTYLTGDLKNVTTKRGATKLAGVGTTLFSSRAWVDYDACKDSGEELCFAPSYPFNPKNTENWSYMLDLDKGSLLLQQPGKTLNLSLSCDSNLMTATHTFLNTKTKYVLSIHHNEAKIPH